MAALQKNQHFEIPENAKAKKIDFRIKTSAKAFKTLIDSTYSRKIHAVVRELCSNAVDIHNFCGKGKVKFEIDLPTLSSMEFRVRDYGTGISEDQMGSVYTVLFESTKENSGTELGKYGLGCKSPFAYSDTFTVSSYQGGVAKHWVANIAGGIPQIVLLRTEETAEPDGLEVKVPVKNGDAPKFAAIVPEILVGFDNKPIVKPVINLPGIDTYWRTDAKSVIEVGDYIFYPAVSGGKEGLYARMGSVIYPINKGEISAIQNFHRDEESFLKGLNGLIDFPIGTLEPVPSREHLSYGREDPTGETISKALALIFENMSKESLEDVSGADSYIKICQTYANSDPLKRLFINIACEKSSIQKPKMAFNIPLSGINRRFVMFSRDNQGNINEEAQRYSYTAARYSYTKERNVYTLNVNAARNLFIIELNGGKRQNHFDESIAAWLNEKIERGETACVLLFPDKAFGSDIEDLRKCANEIFVDVAKLPKIKKATSVSGRKHPDFQLKNYAGNVIKSAQHYVIRRSNGIYDTGGGFQTQTSVSYLLSVHSQLKKYHPSVDDIAIVPAINRSKAKSMRLLTYDELIADIEKMLGDNIYDIEKALIRNAYEDLSDRVTGFSKLSQNHILSAEDATPEAKTIIDSIKASRAGFKMLSAGSLMNLSAFINRRTIDEDYNIVVLKFILTLVKRNFDYIAKKSYRDQMQNVRFYTGSTDMTNKLHTLHHSMVKDMK